MNLFLNSIASLQFPIMKLMNPYIIHELFDSPGWTRPVMTMYFFLGFEGKAVSISFSYVNSSNLIKLYSLKSVFNLLVTVSIGTSAPLSVLTKTVSRIKGLLAALSVFK